MRMPGGELEASAATQGMAVTSPCVLSGEMNRNVRFGRYFGNHMNQTYSRINVGVGRERSQQ